MFNWRIIVNIWKIYFFPISTITPYLVFKECVVTPDTLFWKYLFSINISWIKNIFKPVSTKKIVCLKPSIFKVMLLMLWCKFARSLINLSLMLLDRLHVKDAVLGSVLCHWENDTRENFVDLVAGGMLWFCILFPHVLASYSSHILILRLGFLNRFPWDFIILYA